MTTAITKTEFIPAPAMAHHIAIVGKAGSGKSNAAKAALEDRIAAGERACILDPTGAWWGLRLSRDGKTGSGLDVAIFGGRHADMPIRAAHAVQLAEIVATSSTSCIIDTRLMTVGERTRFFTDFATTLLALNKGALRLVLDECHVFMPQGRVNDPQSGQMLGAANNLVSMGRSAGIRAVLISQRPAKVHKDSLTQVETLVAMRVIAPQDRAAIADWILEWADKDQGKELMASLPSLPTGDAWVWSPAEQFLERVHFPLAATFDSGRPESEAEAAALPPIDMDALRDKLAQIEEERKANDPALLKARIAELQRDAEAARNRAPTADELDAARSVAREAGYDEGWLDGWCEAAKEVAKQLAPLSGAIAGLQEKLAQTPLVPARYAEVEPEVSVARLTPKGYELVTPSAADAAPPEGRTTKISSATEKILAVYESVWPLPIAWLTAAKHAGVGLKSSQFHRYEPEAKATGRIEPAGDKGYRATKRGSPLDLLAAYRAQFSPAWNAMLDVLARGRSPLTKEEIINAAGISPTSSTGGAALATFVREKIVTTDGRGYYVLAEEMRGSR